jgi:hypothetical protein
MEFTVIFEGSFHAGDHSEYYVAVMDTKGIDSSDLSADRWQMAAQALCVEMTP